MKSIKTNQIEAILQAIYQTNISAQNFDAIKKLFADLPNTNETTNKPVDTLNTETKDEVKIEAK
jgi:hypothetical protein